MTALMMDAVRTPETSVHFNVTTRRHITENSKLQKVRSKFAQCYGMEIHKPEIK
jgi:hypothetical protein